MGEGQTRSLHHDVDPLTSFRNAHMRIKQIAQHIAENRQDRRYGYSSHTQCPNNTGNLSWGCESAPPVRGLLHVGESCSCYGRRIPYPIVEPRARIRGNNPDTRAMFVESVSSPIMLLATAAFPFSRPAKHRLLERSAMTKLGTYPSGTSLREQRTSWRDRNWSWMS